MITIRLAQETDLDSILKVIETAFSDEENKVIMNLVQELSRETTSPSIKSLVAEVDNQVIGYVSFSPIFLKSDSSIVWIHSCASCCISRTSETRCWFKPHKCWNRYAHQRWCWCSYWFMETLPTMDGLGSRKRLDAHSCRHTHCNIHLVGQV